jgi:large subunit ribosomal protein L31
LHTLIKKRLIKAVASLYLSKRKLQNKLLHNNKKIYKMKQGIHPENYRLVAFKDMSNDDVFITKSTVETKETITHEGVEYPVFKMEISRTSHPFYTGKSKLIDTAGRIDKFKTKYAKHSK